ncbi:MAG: TIGR01906 family membrane protein [Chloroflexi bacterium]|nr:TIGR01906 family membrane protein [Chloroflexota bacterium]
MEITRRLAVALFIACIPLFLIATNVRWVISAPILYSYGFDKYEIPQRPGIGIERQELLSAARQIRDYFTNGEEYLIVSVVRFGEQVPSLYNSREVLHMKDVKFLVKGVYRLQEISGVYLLVFAAVGLWLGRRSFLPRLGYYGVLGGAITLAVVALAGLASVVGFDQVFLAFHQISFTNDLWQLDPRTDMLLIMFPQGFFLDATLWIAGSTILEALVVVGVSAALMGKERRGSALLAVRRLVGVASPEPTGLA